MGFSKFFYLIDMIVISLIDVQLFFEQKPQKLFGIAKKPKTLVKVLPLGKASWTRDIDNDVV